MCVHTRSCICTHIHENKYLCMLGLLVNLFLFGFSIFLQKMCISCVINEYFVLKEKVKIRNFCNCFKRKNQIIGLPRS